MGTEHKFLHYISGRVRSLHISINDAGHVTLLKRVASKSMSVCNWRINNSSFVLIPHAVEIFGTSVKLIKLYPE